MKTKCIATCSASTTKRSLDWRGFQEVVETSEGSEHRLSVALERFVGRSTRLRTLIKSRICPSLLGLLIAHAWCTPAATQERTLLQRPSLSEDILHSGVPIDDNGRETYNAGWTLAVDNDLLSFSDRDFDYTGGVALTFAGRRAQQWPISLDPIAAWLDPLVPRERGDAAYARLHALQVGLIAFTPDDLNNPLPIADDRPYASMLFLANSRTHLTGADRPVYETSFTLGVLGLDLAKAVHRSLHQVLDQREVPEGWDHQISDGGEPTARFVWARQQLLAANIGSHPGFELKWRSEVSLGYLTEASVALSGRWGRINTPWWSFTPDRADYAPQPSLAIGAQGFDDSRELYLWGGVKLRARAYNVFLQGQFRESEVEVAAGRVERLIGEAWLGVAWQPMRDLRLGYVVRYQTREIKDGPASRGLLWAGVVVTRDFGHADR